MTAQINDIFRYNNKEFAVAGISEGVLFEPSIFNLQPVGASTACWRGYQAVFTVSHLLLILDTLHVNLYTDSEKWEPLEGPTINGISPTGPQGGYSWFNNNYKGLDYHLDYTGGLLLAEGFIQELYVHMGFHPAWKYNHVIELIFSKGVLEKEFDRSELMAEFRQKIINSVREHKPHSIMSDDEIRDFIEKAFDRTYKL